MNKIFNVFRCDNYGRSCCSIGLVSAENSEEARLKLGNKLNNPEIYKTGFYNAKEISQSEIDGEIKTLINSIEFYKNILE